MLLIETHGIFFKTFLRLPGVTNNELMQRSYPSFHCIKALPLIQDNDDFSSNNGCDELSPFIPLGVQTLLLHVFSSIKKIRNILVFLE